jgi:hypothetical protein
VLTQIPVAKFDCVYIQPGDIEKAKRWIKDKKVEELESRREEEDEDA